jgi:hypothetical protein
VANPINQSPKKKKKNHTRPSSTFNLKEGNRGFPQNPKLNKKIQNPPPLQTPNFKQKKPKPHVREGQKKKKKKDHQREREREPKGKEEKRTPPKSIPRPVEYKIAF